MDSIQGVMQWEADHALLSDLGLYHDVPRVSIYTDDAVFSFRPAAGDLETMCTIPSIFAEASRLKINMQKLHTACIRCDVVTRPPYVRPKSPAGPH
jgi:hypothetical protein